MEGIIAHLSKGLTLEQIGPKMNMSAADVKGLVTHPDFDKHFRKLNAKAFTTWKEGSQATSIELVKTEAQKDAKEFYAKLRHIVLTSDELRDKERADLLKDLLKMSDVMGEGVTEEVITLSPLQLEVIKEALGETFH